MKTLTLTLLAVLCLHVTPVVAQSEAHQSPTPAGRETPDYALTAGGIELGGFGGLNVFKDTGQGAEPTLGGEFAVGLHRNFALYAEGAWNSVVAFKFSDVATTEVSASVWDVSGGVQVSVPNKTRVVPYFRAGPSLVVISARAKLGGATIASESLYEFATNLGGGAKVHINANLGVLVDIRGFRGPNVDWWGRATVGVFYQFK